MPAWQSTANRAFANQFDENAILKTISYAKTKFSRDVGCKNFIDIAMDPFNRKEVVIEQGAHQPENVATGGFKLHFTGRGNGGFAFHFCVIQNNVGRLVVIEMSYMGGSV